MIRFENVTKAYPRSARPALDDISLEIVRGQFVFVVGPSGSGKSTMLRLVIREEPTSSGSVLVAGYDLGLLPPRKVPRLRRQ
ncbi:MAG: ATP-binding cassette domain-containing protein, partial [Nostocoides sp.]